MTGIIIRQGMPLTTEAKTEVMKLQAKECQGLMAFRN